MACSKTILVATTNPGKVRELRTMLGDQVQWQSLADFPGVDEVIEDGATFAENARKKALGYARVTGLWTLADDSGLVVDALDGAPGVNSARFSGDKAKGADRKIVDRWNWEKLLSLLQGVPTEKRTARFVCCLCLASPEQVLIETQGTVEGLITTEPAGTGGFGYDPVFFVPQLGRTVAQLGDNEKNAVSHRGNAMRKLKPILVELLNTG
ncbi:MAG: XTP/dITP diphosphatase [Phycisphaerales bacterium]